MDYIVYALLLAVFFWVLYVFSHNRYKPMTAQEVKLFRNQIRGELLLNPHWTSVDTLSPNDLTYFPKATIRAQERAKLRRRFPFKF